MNTFITDNDPKKCAKNLDYKRLGKQRLECLQMLNAMNNPNNKGWVNHPCTEMWKPYQNSLKYYANCMIDEWVCRGYNNTMEKFTDINEEMPWWFYLKELQMSHMASLIRKDRKFYSEIFDLSEVEPYLEYNYVWISKIPKETLEKMKNGEMFHISILAPKIVI